MRSSALAISALMIFIPCPASLPQTSGDAGLHLQVPFTTTFSEARLTVAESDGYDTISLLEADHTTEVGRPRLPAKSVRIALPAGMTATGVRVVSTGSTKLAGEYMIHPVQPPRPIAPPVSDQDFVEPDPRVYASTQAYPGKLAELLYQADLAGQSIAVVRLYPLQYAPAQRELTFHTSITVSIDGRDGYECGDYLPKGISQNARTAYERRIRTMVVNPGEVTLMTSSGSTRDARGVGPGEYEYVIVTPSAWVGDFQPLADWRQRAGIPTTIVTTDWIYNDGGYAGSNLEQVRAFVEDAHGNWGATHFLLGGDTNVIPYHIRTVTVPDYETADIPNDTYYADYDEDWLCEVHVGRAPVRSPTAIATFTDKIFTYEKDPPLSDYLTTVAFFGFDITVPGDHDGEICKENIRNLHLPPSWTLQTEYDDEPGTHKADVIAYLNQGHHLVNHHDHCNTDCMGTGWICHSELLFIPDINALTNGDRQSILFAVGCNPADFPAYTCIGEAFVQHPTGGGVAFMGNTRTGWGGPAEDPDHYSVRQDRLLYKSLFEEGLYRLGECFSYLKNEAYEGPDAYNLGEYTFTQLTLLGDPELSVWTDQPQSLTVTHGETLPVGRPTEFTVQVYQDATPVDGATACLWKDGDFYEVIQTSGGSATFNLTPNTTGTVYVTVTAHNLLPYEGQASVTSAGGIPAITAWGMVTMVLLMLVTGSMIFRRRRVPLCN